jgi:Flp pilus assembly protein TadD
LRIVHIAGNKLIDERQFEKAARIYREGVRRFPSDPNARHNLVAVLERLAIPFAEDARCSEAEPYLTEIQSLDSRSSFPEKARTRCLTERAARRLEANDYAEAVSLMRAALQHRPGDASIKRNLAVALMRWAGELSRSRDCKAAKRLVSEARSLAVPEVTPALDGMLGGCG